MMGRIGCFLFWEDMYLLHCVIEGFQDQNLPIQKLFGFRSTNLLHYLPALHILSGLYIVMEEKTNSSMVSNGGNTNNNNTNVSTEGSASASASCSDIYHPPSSKRLKGIVPQQNGNWGAQIYANNHRVWLGTFKTQKEAAMAYDSAAIRLRRAGDSHRNFPWTSINVEEPRFQSQYSQEDVLEMIKDGSYQPKFADFLRANANHHHHHHDGGVGRLNLSMMQKRGWFSRQILFRKKLTPSDVGKLNRIVIPKKDATTCFPEVSRRVEEDAEAGVVSEAQMDFFDGTMRCWRFRYCYWRSSQSFVFTRGWSRFVKDKNLEADDVVAFYLCEFKEEEAGGKMLKKFFMIDTFRDQDSSSSSSLIEEQIMEETHHPSSCLLDERKGFKLFGVQIN